MHVHMGMHVKVMPPFLREMRPPLCPALLPLGWAVPAPASSFPALEEAASVSAFFPQSFIQPILAAALEPRLGTTSPPQRRRTVILPPPVSNYLSQMQCPGAHTSHIQAR